MRIYKSVIAARNNVTAARNGPSIEISGIIITISYVEMLIKIMLYTQRRLCH